MNVNGRDRVLNPGPLSRRPDKSTTTPRSDTIFVILQVTNGELIAVENEFFGHA
jgi:hypothetical protein